MHKCNSYHKRCIYIYILSKQSALDDQALNQSVKFASFLFKILRIPCFHLRSFAGVPVIANSSKDVTGGTVLVKWEPPMESICHVVHYNVYYREVILQAEKGHWNLITVDRNTTSYTLHLQCWKQYEITVTSLSSYNESDKDDSKIWNFKTGIKGKGLCLTQISVILRGTYGYSILSSGLHTFIFGQIP